MLRAAAMWMGAAGMASAVPAWACRACRGAVDAQVYGPGFAGTLALVLLPVLLLVLAALAVDSRGAAAPPERIEP